MSRSFTWALVACCGLVLYAVMTFNANPGLAVLVGLCGALVCLMLERHQEMPTRAEREAQVLADARRAADRIALERARGMLAEPSIRQVMPNHGAEQEL